MDGVDVETTFCSFSPDEKHIAILDGEVLREWELESDKELKVRESKMDRSSEVKWMQDAGCVYLATITDYLLRVWKLVEKDGVHCLVLFWGDWNDRIDCGDVSWRALLG